MNGFQNGYLMENSEHKRSRKTKNKMGGRCPKGSIADSTKDGGDKLGIEKSGDDF